MRNVVCVCQVLSIIHRYSINDSHSRTVRPRHDRSMTNSYLKLICFDIILVTSRAQYGRGHHLPVESATDLHGVLALVKQLNLVGQGAGAPPHENTHESDDTDGGDKAV